MENIYKLLRMSFSVIVFFLAIALLYSMKDSLDHLLDSTAKHITGDNLVSQTQPLDTNHDSSRAEIIALMMRELEYDIEIIGKTETYILESEGYLPSDIELYPFEGEKFEKSYSYNFNGEIAKIIFRHIEE